MIHLRHSSHDERISLIPIWNHKINEFLFGKIWEPTCHECVIVCDGKKDRIPCEQYFPESHVCAELPCKYVSKKNNSRCKIKSTHPPLPCILGNFILFQYNTPIFPDGW